MNFVYLILLASLFNIATGDSMIEDNDMNSSSKKAYFAAGCFWGVEYLFQSLEGVSSTSVGYMNGKTDNPNYKSVCYEDTGHAEAVEIIYNPNTVSYTHLTLPTKA